MAIIILDAIDQIVPAFKSKKQKNLTSEIMNLVEELTNFFNLEFIEETQILCLIIHGTITGQDVNLNLIADTFGKDLKRFKSYHNILDKLEEENYIVSKDDRYKSKYEAQQDLVHNLYDNYYKPRSFGYETEEQLIRDIQRKFLRKLKRDKRDFEIILDKIITFHQSHSVDFTGLQKLINNPSEDPIKTLFIYGLLSANLNNVDRFDLDDEIASLMPVSQYEELKSKLFSGNDQLVKNKLIRIVKGPFGSSYKPTATLINTALNKPSIQRNFNPEFGIILKPTEIRKEELIYPPLIKNQIDQFELLVQTGQSKSAVNRLKRLGVGSYANPKILLFGSPGSGKTSYAYQLAKKYKRELYVVEFSKLVTKYYGETEQKIVELFEDIRQWQLELRSPGVILLNEIDGLVPRRFGETSNSMEASYNSITNTMLMEFEKIERGIIVATTNSKHMDSAFERRFNFKVYLPKVQGDYLVAIAESKLKHFEKFGIQIDYQEFGKHPLSPSQINNIRDKIAIESVRSGIKDFTGILKQIITEECSMQTVNQRTAIGF